MCGHALPSISIDPLVRLLLIVPLHTCRCWSITSRYRYSMGVDKIPVQPYRYYDHDSMIDIKASFDWCTEPCHAATWRGIFVGDANRKIRGFPTNVSMEVSILLRYSLRQVIQSINSYQWLAWPGIGSFVPVCIVLCRAVATI